MEKKNIVLGVTAGVAIYKSCSLVRILLGQGYNLKIIMSPNAAKLISPLLFESLSRQKVYVEMFQQTKDDSLEHITLAKWADLVLIAPVSANTIAKLANGMCDNLLTTVVLALPKATPVVLAAAMNTNMWDNPVTKKNLSYLSALSNYRIIVPIEGELACGDKGQGAMASLEDILKRVIMIFKK